MIEENERVFKILLPYDNDEWALEEERKTLEVLRRYVDEDKIAMQKDYSYTKEVHVLTTEKIFRKIVFKLDLTPDELWF